jgi:hypothetical protein
MAQHLLSDEEYSHYLKLLKLEEYQAEWGKAYHNLFETNTKLWGALKKADPIAWVEMGEQLWEQRNHEYVR